MKKIKLDNLAKYFDTTRQTIARWKKEENKFALKFADKYLDDDLLEEFFETERISKFEENKYDELTKIQDYLLSNISRKVFEHFRKISNQNERVIFSDFLESTQYKIPVKDINQYISNIDLIKNHFFEEFTTFLFKNKDKYKVNARREAISFMNLILSQEEITMYYCLSYINLLFANEIEKFDIEVDNVGLLKAVINKFFKKQK